MPKIVNFFKGLADLLFWECLIQTQETKQHLVSLDSVLLLVSTIGFGILTYLLFFYQPRLGIIGREVIGNIESSGIVRRRHAGTLSWENIKGVGPIYRNDILFVPQGTECVVVFLNRQRLELSSDSMVSFDEITKDNVEITLISGEVKKTDEVKVVKKESQKLVAKPVRGAKLLVYIKELTPLDLRFSELDQRFRQLQVGGGAREKIKEGTIKFLATLNKLSHFDIFTLRPKENSQLSIQSNPWVELIWTPVPLDSIQYEIQISKEKSFNRFISYETNQNQLKVQLLDAAHYYWRIKAKRQRDILLSEMGHFSLSEDTGSIHPLLQKLSKGSGPKGFTLEVARDVQFNTVVSTQVSNSPKCSDQGLTAGTYYCRVLGIGASKMNKTYVFVVK